MANDSEYNYSDEYDDIDEGFLESTDDAYDLDFNERKISRKLQRAKSKTSARHRLEDYFEKKALRDDDWDFDYDYE